MNEVATLKDRTKPNAACLQKIATMSWRQGKMHGTS